MSHDPTPIDDELVAAVLDGEATAAERALVEGSPEGRRRLAAMARVAGRVAEPVPPPDPAWLDEAIGRALDAAAPPSTGRPVPEPTPVTTGPPPAPVRPSGGPIGDDGDLARRRRARADRARRVVPTVAAVVVGVALLGGLIALVGRSGGSQSASDSASSAASGAERSRDAASTAGPVEGAASGLAGAVPDLGTAADGDALLDRLDALVLAPGIDQQFEEPASGSGRSSGSGGAAPADTRPPLAATPGGASDALGPPACSAPEPPIAPEDAWAVVATGRLAPGTEVVIVADGRPAAGVRTLVLDATTCAVLVDRPI